MSSFALSELRRASWRARVCGPAEVVSIRNPAPRYVPPGTRTLTLPDEPQILDPVQRLIEAAGSGHSTGRIIRAVAEHFKVAPIEILAKRRWAETAMPRHIAMYIAVRYTRKSFPEVGRRFGGRDHSTVVHAVRKIDALVESGDEVKNDIEIIASALGLSREVVE